MLEKCLPLALFSVFCLAPFAPAQVPAQTTDPDYAAQVKQWTTRPEFMSPLVDHLPKSSTVPSPKDVLGYHIGAPKKLTYYADVVNYYRTLAAKSPRIKVINIGKTEEGRAAIVKTSAGQGEVVMFTTNPVWRWQNIGEFRMMFNTILNYKNLDAHTQSTDEHSDVN